MRTRLLDVLDAGVDGPLTLLAAPAGAGKSALLSSWVGHRKPPGPVAWLSLDGDDADRRRFWRAVVATLGRATGDAAVSGLSISPREPFTMDLVLSALVDALAPRGEPVVLVLDDFQEVADVVQGDVERLVRFPPPALRLVIGTRADPTIGLGRLRLDGRLTEIRGADLAFTLDETVALFAALEIDLPAADLETLWRRTEGWAAALRLAAVSLEHHPDPAGFIAHFAGTDVTISDYLLSEVLARQPPDLRAFLLRTSVVDTLSVELANALTGSSEAQAALARLERGGVLTTPLDEHGTWHRYHPLFAELLRAELRSQLPDEVEPLHARAAGWLAEHGEIGAAMRHAATAGAWDLAAELVTRHWMQLLIEGETGALRPIVEAMPRERVDACAELALAFAGSYLARGDRARAAPLLRRAQELAAEVPAVRRPHFAASMAAVQLYEGRVRGDPRSALRAARELLEGRLVLEEGELGAGVRAFVLAQLGVVELWTGDLDAAVGHLERGHAIARDDGHDWTAMVAGAYLAVARVFRGEIARGLAQAQAAVALAERRGWTRWEPAGAAYSVLAAVAIQRGRIDEASELVDRAGDALRTTHDHPLRAAHALNRALLLSDRGEPEAALGVLQAARDEIGEWPLLPQLQETMVAQEALLRAAVGEREAARRLLEREREPSLAVANALAKLRLLEGDPAAARSTLKPHLGTDGRVHDDSTLLSVRAEAWLLDALASDALAEHDAAAQSLEHSLDLADPAGLQRLILTHGNLAVPVLHRHSRRGTAHPAMVGAALAAIEHRDRHHPRAAAAQPAERLSEREQAILRYLPTMMSNQEIAGELFVSVNTIKTHLKAIYRKLDAAGRREAVDRARNFGLLP